MKYKVVVVIWNDHTHVSRQALPSNQDELICPTLSIGLLLKKTKNTVLLVQDIERYLSRDECSYLIILRPTIIAIKEYGEIEIENLRISE